LQRLQRVYFTFIWLLTQYCFNELASPSHKAHKLDCRACCQHTRQSSVKAFARYSDNLFRFYHGPTH